MRSKESLPFGSQLRLFITNACDTARVARSIQDLGRGILVEGVSCTSGGGHPYQRPVALGNGLLSFHPTNREGA